MPTLQTWRQASIGIIVAVLGMAPAKALAVDWRLAPAQSQVLFEYQRDGTPTEGRFRVFAGGGVFDRDAPGDARLELRIESTSIDLDDSMTSAFATSAEWFDSANHPQVIYRLLKLTPQGGDRYHAEGRLMIRGRTKLIATTITLRIGAGEAHATGSLLLDRKDFLLGIGPSALFVDIGREVAVHFDLTAHPIR